MNAKMSMAFRVDPGKEAEAANIILDAIRGPSGTAAGYSVGRLGCSAVIKVHVHGDFEDVAQCRDRIRKKFRRQVREAEQAGGRK